MVVLSVLVRTPLWRVTLMEWASGLDRVTWGKSRIVGINWSRYVFLNDGNGQFGVPTIRRSASLICDSMRCRDVELTMSQVCRVSGIGDFIGDSTADIGAVIKQTGGGSLQLVVYYWATSQEIVRMSPS